MIEKLLDLVRENWLKYKSIPVFFVFLCGAYCSAMSAISNWDNLTLKIEHYFIFALLFLMVFIWYIISCFVHNRLPKASENTLAVLFVIDAESKQLFEDVKYKLVNNFRQSIISDDFSKFSAICVPKERVAQYQLNKKTDALDLLIKTNCIFLVTVHYMVDSVSNAEDFELSVNYGVRHPRFNKDAEAVLSHDLTALNASIGKRRFIKSQTIDVFNFTTQTLVYVCQYILGFVYLLSGNTTDASVLLEIVNKSLSKEDPKTPGITTLKHLVNDRLFVAYIQIAINHMAHFKKDKGYHHLHAMCGALTQANFIRSDTYVYNLNMAYAYIILDKDVHSAMSCIAKCKQSKHDKAWMYSEAFLSAYSGQAPSVVCSKYKKALEIPYYNLVDIVDYIEFVLEHEPEKDLLHLAAGLVYEAIDDQRLMKKHFSIYLEHLDEKEKRIEALLISKMKSANCGKSCAGECKYCSEQNVA